MARLYRNEVIVNGGEVVLEMLERIGAKDGVEEVDFGKVIPYPDEYGVLDKRAREFAREYERITHKYERPATRTQKLYALTQRFGVSPDTMRLPTGLERGGFQWQLENWGSSNAENFFLRTVQGDVGWYANLSFVTDHGMPVPVFSKLSEMFGDLYFWMHSKQTWNNIDHHMRIHRGIIPFKISRKGFPIFVTS